VLSLPVARLAEHLPYYPDLTDIKGQEITKRSLGIAAVPIP